MTHKMTTYSEASQLTNFSLHISHSYSIYTFLKFHYTLTITIFTIKTSVRKLEVIGQDGEADRKNDAKHRSMDLRQSKQSVVNKKIMTTVLIGDEARLFDINV